jgi:hypothetical protein
LYRQDSKILSVATIQETGGQIKDEFEGISISVYFDSDNAVPYALTENVERPMQLFTLWYGFSLTYPECIIYKD